MSSNNTDDDWNKVEVDDVAAQVKKIEFEEEERRKLNSKDFPSRVTTTEDEDSSENVYETEIDLDNIEEPESLVSEDIGGEKEDPTPSSAIQPVPPTSTTHVASMTSATSTTSSARSSFQFPQIEPLVLYPKSAAKDAVKTSTLNEPSPVETPAPTPAATTATPNKTRLHFSPLALPPPNTDGFAQVLKERTRQRRAQEDAAVSAVRVQVTRLEAALAAESKRRVAALQLLQKQATEAAETLQEQVQTQIKEEVQSVHTRLDQLEERFQQLESKYANDMMALRHDVAVESERMQSQLRTLQQNVAREEQKLHTRHEQTMDHMQSVADDYNARWKAEREERLIAVQSLQDTMESVHSSRAQNLATFEGQLSYELEQLKVAVETESGEREMYDQEIVDALNRYIQQLQESLAQAVTQGRVY